MRNNSILQLIVPAVLLALLIASAPTGPIAAQGCVDENGRPMTCPEEPKKRPTVVYPSFTPTVTLTPVPTATKVPTKTSTVVPSATTITSKIPAAVDFPVQLPGFLWPAGVLLVVVGVLVIAWLWGGGGEESSTFAAEAHGDLNTDTEHETFEMHGDVSGDDNPDSQDGMFEKKEDE